MYKSLFTLFSILFCSAVAFTQTQIAPVADHHQHLFSPAMAEFQKVTPITAQDVITLLDAAGIERAVLLSTAYSYGRPGREPQNEYERVKEENDWVGAQAALFPKRLVGFCGFNPFKEYALSEIERCSKNPNLRRGIKMHFGNSDVQLQNPEHIEKLKAIFRAANAKRMSMVIHMRASISLNRPYGAEEVRAFLEQLLPLASDVTVQIAHLAGTGPGFEDPKQDVALDAFVEALSKGTNNSANGKRAWWRDKRYRNLWFDITTSAHTSNTPERSALLIKRLRQIGMDRILYGTDAALGTNLRPKEAWAEVLKLGLTDQEVRTIARNKAPYLR